MSSFLYGAITNRKVEERRVNQLAGADDDKKKWLETLAALVPAEALGVITATRILFTKTIDAATAADPEATTTVITRLGLARLCTYAAIVLAMGLYALARFIPTDDTPSKPGWNNWDIARLLIPGLAAVAWLMLGYTPIFNAVFARIDDGWAFALAVIGSVLLGAAAKYLRYKPS